MTFKIMVLLLSLIMTPFLAAQEQFWNINFQKALKTAQQSNLDLLIYFCGDDWNIPSRRMDQVLFSDENLQLEIKKNYVPVRVEFPKDNKFENEAKQKQNTELANLYGLEVLPSLMLTDASGIPYAILAGNYQGDSEAFKSWLISLDPQKKEMQNLKKLADSSSAGEAKAKALDQLYQKAQSFGIQGYFSFVVLQVQKEDKDNKLGLKQYYRALADYYYLLNSWTELKSYQDAIDAFEKLLNSTLTMPDIQQKILFTQGMIYWNALKDEKRAKINFKKILLIKKDTPTALKSRELLNELP